MKSSMIGGILIAVLMLITAGGKTLQIRLIFAAIGIIAYYFIFFWVFIEYDRERTKAWKKKEKRLRENPK